MPRRVARSSLLAFVLMALSGCTSFEPSIDGRSTNRPISDRIAPMCQLGCLEQDPNPDSAGYFIGATNTDLCPEGTDSDLDGLSDFCEKNLAAAFAPELKYSSMDEVGREPKWVAQWQNDSTVRIVYLLSYYRDAGSQVFGCSLPFAPDSCFGHNGDSENILLDIIYHSASSHWVLNRAEYSEHMWFGIYEAGSGGYAWLEYPTKAGGYPRSWVSEGKHANYRSQAACNAGGDFHADTCVNVNASARVTAGAAANIGSRAHHTTAQNCWASQDPSYQYYGSGRLECYWTNDMFRGWIPVSVGGMESTPYGTILEGRGF